MRRILLIIALVLVVLGLGAAAYFYFSGQDAGVAVAPSDGTTLPGSGSVSGAGGGSETQTESAQPAPEPVTARLVKISAGPVVPGVSAIAVPAVNASSTASTRVSFIERRSGNVFSYDIRARSLSRTSNKTIPGIQSASWLPDGSLAFVRYLSGEDFSGIQTYGLPAAGGNGFFLNQNIADIAVASTSLLTLASGVSGSIASVSRTDGSRPAQAFTTPLSSLRIGFLGKGKYLAFTKPSATLPGYAFAVDASGRFSRIAGPLTGLVALPSPSGAWLLVSYTRSGTLESALVNASTGEALPLPVATIADKCVWSADSAALYCGIPVGPSPAYAYPDDWYQGAASFSDRIWKIQVSGRYAQLILDFSEEAGGGLDAYALAVDPQSKALVFVNKKDGSLWSYEL